MDAGLDVPGVQMADSTSSGMNGLREWCSDLSELKLYESWSNSSSSSSSSTSSSPCAALRASHSALRCSSPATTSCPPGLSTNGCCKSWSAGRRLSGFFCRHALTNDENSSDHLSGSANAGGSFFGMCSRAFMGCMWLSGGKPWLSSSSVMPNDHMSAFALYGLCPVLVSITSGAIQWGVPVNVLGCANRRFPEMYEMPKSTSLTSPCRVISTLAHLMSRWMMDCEWRYLTAWRTSCATYRISASVKPCRHTSKMSVRAPPSQNSIAINTSSPLQ
mmetsp:Transcript_51579/g.129401  ORF Transcript_51579/g.129401 Transcript_51579/m.129401 type:complete len:275 (+) Transcript_51579:2730-3554(+)